MEIRYNVTGAKRKEPGQGHFGCHRCQGGIQIHAHRNYEIDYFTVTKEGTLLFDDRADSEEVEQQT